MDIVSNGEEGLDVTTSAGDRNCVCWSPQRTEEICMCNFPSGHVIPEISAGDVMEKQRSPGLRHHNKLGRRAMKHQLEELLIVSDLILQNSIRLQLMSENLLHHSMLLQDLCVISEDNESMSEPLESKIEENERVPEDNDSMTHKNDSMTQESGSMTGETSLGSRSS